MEVNSTILYDFFETTCPSIRVADVSLLKTIIKKSIEPNEIFYRNILRRWHKKCKRDSK
jgi:hypothetical protein